MDDSSGVLALLAAAVPEGPRDHELMSLHRLSLCIAAGFGMPVPVAGQTVVRALRGADQWEGEPPASLPVYVLYTTGPRCLTDSDELPERKEVLRHLAESLALRGCPISEVPESCYSRHGHAGRFLAVVEADAWRAFGLPDHAHAQAQATPAPAVIQSEPAAEPEQPAGPVWKIDDEWTPAAVAEMARLYEQEELSLSSIGRIMGELVGGSAISRQRVREKIPDAVRGGKGKCKGARG